MNKCFVLVLQMGLISACSAEKEPTPHSYNCEKSFATTPKRDDSLSETLIVNASEGYRVVFQFAPEEGFVDRGGVNPGENLRIVTKGSQRWMITDGPGNCLTILDGPLGDNYSITVPTGNFGPE